MNERINRLKTFLKNTPDDCFLNHALALEYVKQGDDTDARVCFEKNLHTDADYVATYYHLGKLLERAGAQQDAIPVYEKGMEIAKKAGDMHTYNELQGAYEDLVY
jgi:Tfp pilus assembly protein PilF